jgi:hypothetical protein
MKKLISKILKLKIMLKLKKKLKMKMNRKIFKIKNQKNDKKKRFISLLMKQ